MRQYQSHRSQSIGLFKRRGLRRFTPGQKVLIKVIKSPVHKKSSSVFTPNFTRQVYTVKNAYENEFPPVYSMEEVKEDHRRFYGFELQPVDDLFGNLASNKEEEIFVKGIQEQSLPYLRSGRTPEARKDVIYQVVRDDEETLMTKEQLLNIKKLFGVNALSYATVFQLPDMQKYIV